MSQNVDNKAQENRFKITNDEWASQQVALYS